MRTAIYHTLSPPCYGAGERQSGSQGERALARAYHAPGAWDGHLGVIPSLASWGDPGGCGVRGGSHMSINNGPMKTGVETQERKQLVLPRELREGSPQAGASQMVLGG